MWGFNRHNIMYEKIAQPWPRYRPSSPGPDDDVPPPESNPVRRTFNRNLAFFVLGPATILAFIVLGAMALARTMKPELSQIVLTASIPHDYCGNTPTQAKAAGCKFEVNNFAWLHPACYDAELDEDWKYGPLSKDLEFWENKNGIGRIPNELVFEGEVPMVWVNTRQHRRHCLLIWEKYQRAAMNRRPMDNWTIDYKHTKHCVNIIRDPERKTPDDLVTSFLALKYPTCEYGPIQISSPR
jgi:hypothetical protein